MQRLRSWISRDPGLALLLLGMILATALYAPTLTTGIVNYDDPWLYRDNFVVQDASWDSIVAIFTDLDPRSPLRHTLAPEYLPVRDLSVMLDFALWGDRYGGFHGTNLVVYLIAIAMVFRMLTAFGLPRVTSGIAVLIFALHPAHAESVAWLSERKGLLGIVFGATAGFAYARYRAAPSTKRAARWLILAALASVAAVWSKAPAAFTIAALAGLELIQPAQRVSWRRSLTGLGVIAVVAVIAYIPVVKLAISVNVIGESIVPGSKAEVVLGVHGFYVRLAGMVMSNAPSYPISSVGPSVIDLVLGAVAMLGALAVFVPRLRAPVELKAGAVLWLVAWLPIGHLVLPLHQVGVADRYALVMVLGFALALATGIRRLSPRLQIALVAVIAIAASVRTLDAQATWGSDLLLWERAVASNPHNLDAWSAYAMQLDAAGMPDEAEQAIEVGLSYGESGRLLLRKALFQMAQGDPDGLATLQRAAEAGEPIAMANLAQLLLERGRRDEALAWGRRASTVGPMIVHTRRSHGMVALATKHAAEALEQFSRALALEPSATNRYNVALALIELGRRDEALPLLVACSADPRIGPRARARLAELRAVR